MPQTKLVSVLAKPMPLDLFRQALDALLPGYSGASVARISGAKELKTSGENALGSTHLNWCFTFCSTWGGGTMRFHMRKYGLTVVVVRVGHRRSCLT